MPHHYHLRIQSAIFWITFLGIALLAQQPASAQQLRRIYYGTSASVSHLPVWVAKDAGLFAAPRAFRESTVKASTIANIRADHPARIFQRSPSKGRAIKRTVIFNS
jgi:hypothetical protein